MVLMEDERVLVEKGKLSIFLIFLFRVLYLMHIPKIESTRRGEYRDQHLCEDGIFIENKIVTMIDGVTSHGTLFWHGGSSGRFAKEVLGEYLRSHEDELAELSAKECFHRLIVYWRSEARKFISHYMRERRRPIGSRSIRVPALFSSTVWQEKYGAMAIASAESVRSCIVKKKRWTGCCLSCVHL